MNEIKLRNLEFYFLFSEYIRHECSRIIKAVAVSFKKFKIQCDNDANFHIQETTSAIERRVAKKTRAFFEVIFYSDLNPAFTL